MLLIRLISTFSLLSFIIGTLFPLSSSAGVFEESKHNIVSEDFIMATMAQLPYGYLSETGEYTGIWYEILNKIILESGIDIKNKIVPTKRLVRFLDSNHNICTILADNNERSGNFDVLGEIGQTLSAGILPKKGIKIETYADLKNITIAVPLGIEFYNAFDNDLALKKVHPSQYQNVI